MFIIKMRGLQTHVGYSYDGEGQEGVGGGERENMVHCSLLSVTQHDFQGKRQSSGSLKDPNGGKNILLVLFE